MFMFFPRFQLINEYGACEVLFLHQNKNMTEVMTSFLTDRYSSVETFWLTGECIMSLFSKEKKKPQDKNLKTVNYGSECFKEWITVIANQGFDPATLPLSITYEYYEKNIT